MIKNLQRFLPRIAFVGWGLADVVLLSAQSDTVGVDTTDWRYRIGYEIGSWMPFLIIFTLALAVIIRQYRLSQRDGR